MKSSRNLNEIIKMLTNGSKLISGRTGSLFAPRLVYDLRPGLSDAIDERIVHPQLYSENKVHLSRSITSGYSSWQIRTTRPENARSFLASIGASERLPKPRKQPAIVLPAVEEAPRVVSVHDDAMNNHYKSAISNNQSLVIKALRNGWTIWGLIDYAMKQYYPSNLPFKVSQLDFDGEEMKPKVRKAIQGGTRYILSGGGIGQCHLEAFKGIINMNSAEYVEFHHPLAAMYAFAWSEAKQKDPIPGLLGTRGMLDLGIESYGLILCMNGQRYAVFFDGRLIDSGGQEAKDVGERPLFPQRVLFWWTSLSLMYKYLVQN